MLWFPFQDQLPRSLINGGVKASIVRCLISETRVLTRSSSAAGGPVSPDYPNPGQVALSILSHPSPWAYLQVIMEAEELWWPWPPSAHRISHFPPPSSPSALSPVPCHQVFVMSSKSPRGWTRNGLAQLGIWLSGPAVANMWGREKLVCFLVEMMVTARARHKSTE